MRAALILAVAILATATTSDAEARGRRGGRGVGVGAGVGVGVGVTMPVSHARSYGRKTPAAPATDPAFIRPILPVRAPLQTIAPAPTRSASAGCASGRLIGQGSGFCQIN